jgi:hypothetical protein
VIYPGKLTVADTFRIGCIGRLNAEADMRARSVPSPPCWPNGRHPLRKSAA